MRRAELVEACTSCTRLCHVFSSPNHLTSPCVLALRAPSSRVGLLSIEARSPSMKLQPSFLIRYSIFYFVTTSKNIPTVLIPMRPNVIAIPGGHPGRVADVVSRVILRCELGKVTLFMISLQLISNN